MLKPLAILLCLATVSGGWVTFAGGAALVSFSTALPDVTAAHRVNFSERSRGAHLSTSGPPSRGKRGHRGRGLNPIPDLPLEAGCPSLLPRRPLPSSDLPSACAVFFTYGGIARYETEVVATITELKRLNPSVRTILVTDNCQLQGAAIDDIFRIPRPQTKSWAPRLEFLASNMSRYFGHHCSVALALDSHVTLCDSSLHERMAKELQNSGKHRHLLAANAEHAPYHPELSSPFSYFLSSEVCGGRKKCHAHLPHNFAILFNPSSTRVHLAFEKWREKMHGASDDDQVPLMNVLERLSSRGPRLKRLDESFAFAFKSVDKKRFGGDFPRFSYRIDQGPVTLFHSTDRRVIPAAFNGSTCAFLNQGRMEPRMAWLPHPKTNVQLLRSRDECIESLQNIEPRLCDEALMWGASASKDGHKTPVLSQQLQQRRKEVPAQRPMGGQMGRKPNRERNAFAGSLDKMPWP